MHKWIESLAIILLYKSNKRIMFYATTLLALITPLGMSLGYFLTTYLHSYTMLGDIIDSIATATFIYIGTLHGLKKSVLIDKCCNLRDYTWVIVGFLSMSMLAIGHSQLH